MSKLLFSRRMFLTGSAAGVSSLVLAGCDQFDFLGQTDNQVRNFIERANTLTYQSQRIIAGQQALARTYDASEIRQPQRPNGSTDPQTDAYLMVKANNFADYKLRITGLVENQLEFSLDQLDRVQVFGLFVAKRPLDPDSDRRAVRDRQRLVVEAIGQDRLRMVAVH